ncbi:MAG: site-2 protease family protein [Thermoanaerobaculia bacterium]
MTRANRWRWPLAAVLFLATFFTTTTLGAGWYLFTRVEVVTDLLPWLGPETVRRVWGDPALLRLGLAFSLPTLCILLCHEMGHWLACRRYGLPATPPFFLPAPIGLGTLGAFIRIRAPLRIRRELFDIGVAGPLAGFAALLPFLLYGVARSTPMAVAPVPPNEAIFKLLLPGGCLAIELLTRAFHGPLPSGVILELHPAALAAWVGLLVTALNLLPLGQLDGGHILYAATGRLQRWLAPPLWVALAIAGWFWKGWWIWCVVVLVMGLAHPPVRDELPPLGLGRVTLALLAAAIFALSFMPLPLTEVLIR